MVVAGLTASSQLFVFLLRSMGEKKWDLFTAVPHVATGGKDLCMAGRWEVSGATLRWGAWLQRPLEAAICPALPPARVSAHSPPPCPRPQARCSSQQ